MEFDILYLIQNYLRFPWIDSFMVHFTRFMGAYGQIWTALGLFLTLFKKTRKCGYTILLSYSLVWFVGQYGLKDWIARPRPCQLSDVVKMAVDCPSSFSCPSTHSGWAFAAATSIFCYNKKWGSVTFAVAILTAFSRMYLFVHFPTDVLLGMVMGIGFGFISWPIVKRFINA